MRDPHYAQQGLHVHAAKSKMDQVVYQKALLVEQILQSLKNLPPLAVIYSLVPLLLLDEVLVIAQPGLLTDPPTTSAVLP